MPRERVHEKAMLDKSAKAIDSFAHVGWAGAQENPDRGRQAQHSRQPLVRVTMTELSCAVGNVSVMPSEKVSVQLAGECVAWGSVISWNVALGALSRASHLGSQ
jgi:hypothetical protein